MRSNSAGTSRTWRAKAGSSRSLSSEATLSLMLAPSNGRRPAIISYSTSELVQTDGHWKISQMSNDVVWLAGGFRDMAQTR
jgi:hypothetical protein